MKVDHFLTPYTKINSKWIKDLHVRLETIKILEKNSDSNFFDICCSYIFLDTSPQARETRAKMNGFANDISGRGFISKIHKEHIQLSTHTQSDYIYIYIYIGL